MKPKQLLYSAYIHYPWLVPQKLNWIMPVLGGVFFLTSCSTTPQQTTTSVSSSTTLTSFETGASISTEASSDSEISATNAGMTTSFATSSDTYVVTETGETESTSSTSTSDEEQASLLFLQIDPPNKLIELDHGQSTQMNYIAKGYFSDGTTKDLTSEAVWAIDNAALGSFQGSFLHVPGFNQTEVQVAHISASVEDTSDETTVIVVSYRQTGDKNDFLFVLPYVDKEGLKSQTLDFNTNIKSIDLFLNMDVTVTMEWEIKNLQDGLLNEVLPTIQERIPDLQAGVGAFADFPHPGFNVYGEANCKGSPDQPFNLVQTITADDLLVHEALLALTIGENTIGCGDDLPESQAEALYQIATGEGIVNGPYGAYVEPHTGIGIGGVGFRSGVMPIIVSVSDAPTHDPGTNDKDEAVALVAHSKSEAISAMNHVCARVVGIASSAEAIPDMLDFVEGTQSKVPPTAWGPMSERPGKCAENECCTGMNGEGQAPGKDGLCSLVYSVAESGEGVSQSVTTGIDMLTRFATFNVETFVAGQKTGLENEVLPDNTSTANFIKQIIPKNFVKPPAPPILPDPVIDMDAFKNVTPGTKVQFDVVAFNDFVKPTTKPQLFAASIHLSADGCTELDTRSVIIFIPPAGIIIE